MCQEKNLSNLLDVDGDNIVIVMHKKPDADALAAASILKKYYETKYSNKKTYIVADFKFTVRFPNIIKNYGQIISGEQIPEKSHIFVVDHNEREVSILKDGTNPNISNITIIDHHYVVSPEIDEKPLRVEPKKYIDTTKYSTCEILFDYLKTLDDFEITQEIATYIYIGIFSDSLNFHTPFKRNLLAKVGELVDKYNVDIDNNAIYCYGKQIYYMRIMSFVFKDIKKPKNSRIATLYISNKQYELMSRCYLSPVHACIDLLNARDIYYVVCAYEFSPKRGCIRVCSRIDDAIKHIMPSAKHGEVNNVFNLEESRCKIYVDSIVKSMQEYDRNLNGEQEFNSECPKNEMVV